MPMRTGLDATDLADLLEGTDIGVIATRRPDDSIMLSPVWWEWRDGGINVWVDAETDRKVQHIRRDPRVTFVIPNQVWPYRGFEVRGEATLSGDDFYGVLERTATRFDGPDAAAEMVASYAPGVVIRLEPGATRGWAYED